jgi:pretoxin HINT domain-containing protein
MRERVPQTLLAENLGPNSGLQAVAVAAVTDRGRIDRRISPAGTFEAKIPIGKMVAEIRKTAAVAAQQLEADIQVLESYNQRLARANEPVIQVLRHFSDRDIKPYKEAWLNDWRDSQGYAPASERTVARPTLAQAVPLAYQPQAVESYLYDPVVGYLPRPRGSCFGAGTLVHTLTGPRPIESIAVGDQVLTQDPTSGALGYHPVIAVFHNRPAAALRINLGSDAVVATGIHRFWKAGSGWVMARELRPGDAIRTAEGLAHVTSVEPEKVQPVFNLEIGGPPTYFVGTVAALAHDNTLVQPPGRRFDASVSTKLQN